MCGLRKLKKNIIYNQQIKLQQIRQIDSQLNFKLNII